MKAEQLGALGVWTWLDTLSGAEAAGLARRVEGLGYSALWVPEAVGRDPFALLGFLAASTERLTLATGIANIYARDPMATRAVQHTLGELSGGRFVLGLGVSHAHLVAGVRGHEYRRPLSAMRAYLDAMEKALYQGPKPERPTPIVLAALGPKMLRLAGERTAGAHPYFVPPEHTRRARQLLGEGPTLAPEQKVLLETDPVKARAAARTAMRIYLGLPNYQNNLRTLGYTDADFDNGGSDRLVDDIVAWGDEAAIARRIQEHRDAGADHVCIQPLRPDGQPGPDLRVLEAMAPAR
jgi:probable F420-dependent oxidoreductase